MSTQGPAPAVRGAHEPVVCAQINASHDYHTKSHSYRFECPTCGASQRRNTNFLGNAYRLVCHGDRIVRTHRDDIPGSLRRCRVHGCENPPRMLLTFRLHSGKERAAFCREHAPRRGYVEAEFIPIARAHGEGSR